MAMAMLKATGLFGTGFLRPANLIRRLHGPPIKDEFVKGETPFPKVQQLTDPEETELENHRDKIRKMGTVEEKLYYLNSPKYYGWYSCIVKDTAIPHDFLHFTEYATATRRISKGDEDSGLPSRIYGPLEEPAKKLALDLAKSVKAYIKDFYENRQFTPDIEKDQISWHEVGAKIAVPTFAIERRRQTEFIDGLNHLLMRKIDAEHLRSAYVETAPRNEGFWFRGGIHPDKAMIKKREGTKEAVEKKGEDFSKYYKRPDRIHESYDRAIQYLGKPLLQIRHRKMLEEFFPLDDPMCIRNPGREESDTYPQCKYDPRTWGVRNKHINGTNIPGHWTGTKHEHSNLTFLSDINEFKNRTSAGGFNAKKTEVPIIKAIWNSYGLLLAEACYLGFGPFTNPTYPLTTQTIVTNGRNFHLSAYQLNVTELHKNNDDADVKKHNLIWTEPEEELYSDNNEINEDLLAKIIKLYLLEPKRESLETPFLHPKYKYAHQIPKDHEREYFLQRFKYMYSNRPRSTERPEIQTWQKIHFIDHPGPYKMMLGNRESMWFINAKTDFLGKETFHPEFIPYDKYKPPRVLSKYRKSKAKGRGEFLKKVIPPINLED